MSSHENRHESYTVEIAGLTRNLRLFEIKPGLKIAILNILGDTELVQACAQELAQKLKDVDYELLVTAEAKSIPLAQLTLWSIVVAGTISALQRFFNVTAFLTGLGILGFTIGFALQDIMKNFASGVILLLQQPFHVGEMIGVKGFDGTVLAIDLRATEMRAADGRVVILPNADVLANPIINYSRAQERRVEFSFNMSHTSDPRAVRQIVLEAIQNVEGYVDTPAPVIVLNNITDHALELNANFWIDVTKNDPLHAKDTVLLNVKSEFNEQGIEIPHPIQAVFSTQVHK